MEVPADSIPIEPAAEAVYRGFSAASEFLPSYFFGSPLVIRTNEFRPRCRYRRRLSVPLLLDVPQPWELLRWKITGNAVWDTTGNACVMGKQIIKIPYSQRLRNVNFRSDFLASRTL